ncbi:MAG: amidohydrolase family protein [Candidatus Aminicenantaceae bacterium]
MKVNKCFSFIICISILFIFLSISSSARVGPTYAIVNCKIIPVSAPEIPKGVIIIRDGLIESLGPSEVISIPEDAEVIEAEGLTAYPGLIDAHTSLFIELPKKETVQTTGSPLISQEKESGRYPDVMVFKVLKPKKSKIESFHKIGVTTVLVAQEKGIYTGQSVLLNLNGDEKEKMVIKNPFALHISFSTAKGVYPASVMGTMALLRQSFLDAEHYNTYKSFFIKAGKGIKRPEYNPFLEALVPFTQDKKPIVFNCKNQEDIKRALGLIKEFKLNALLSGANEAWRVAEYLKKAEIPLLVSLDFKPPYSSIYVNQGEELKKKAEKEIYPANASNLHKSGVKFALTSYGLTTADKFLGNIQNALKAGLPKEEALKALTIHPAQYLGVGNLIGSLEPGKIANVILVSGEIFEDKSRVEKVFVDGVLFKMKKPPQKAKAAALNIAGKWTGTVSGPMGELETTVEFEQEGNKIIGTISSNFGIWEITEGILSGEELDFTFIAKIMDETVEMTFSGKVEKDLIEGTVDFPGGSAELQLKKAPENSF